MKDSVKPFRRKVSQLIAISTNVSYETKQTNEYKQYLLQPHWVTFIQIQKWVDTQGLIIQVSTFFY